MIERVTPGHVVVVGLGNTFRRDDAVGVVAADALQALGLPGVVVHTGITEPLALLEAFGGAAVAVVLDAARVAHPVPGRVRRWDPADVRAPDRAMSSHAVDVGRAYELSRTLRRAPATLVLFTVDVVDTGNGIGLTPAVARAVPELVESVAVEVNRARTGAAD